MLIEDQMRVAHVNRWQIVRTAREQTLAEHLYRVFLIVRHFGPQVGLDPEDQKAAENFALLHDLPEVKTGDIASPVKSMLPSLESIEAEYSRDHLDAMAACTRTALKLVKMADLVEAVCFLSVEGMGTHAAEVHNEIYNRVLNMIKNENWPIMSEIIELMESQ